jgi:hypothetical protein
LGAVARSFAMARLTCVLAVTGLITMRAAISWLDRPWATRATAPRSRVVSCASATVSAGGGWVT